MGKRSSAYPSYTISESLEFAERIYKNYGDNYRATREDIADALNYSAGSLTQKVSSASQYGFLDMKSKEGYKVTDLFIKCFRPLSDESKQKALVEAFCNPPLYVELIESFKENYLPPVKPLSNILFQKHSISDSASDKAAEIFVSNAESIGVLNKEKFLTFKSELEDEEDVFEEIEDDINNERNAENNYSPVIIPPKNEDKNFNQDEVNPNQSINKNAIPHNIPLKNKLPAQLLLPSDINSADFDFIISYIGLIRNQY